MDSPSPIFTQARQNSLFPCVALAVLAFTVAFALMTKAAFADQNFRLRANNVEQSTLNSGDIDVEISYGRTIAARILGRYRLYQDDKLSRYVSLVGNAVAQNASRNELAYYFAVLDTPQVNAYSAPGGYIFITRGALATIQDEAELAAVLAHEIAHVTERHIVNELKIRSQDKSAMASVGQLIGGSSATAKSLFNQLIDKAVNILFERGYLHEDELEADRVASQLLATTGYDPTALLRYLTNLQRTLAENAATEASTHPPSPVRLTALHQVIDAEKFNTLDFPKVTHRFKHYVSVTP